MNKKEILLYFAFPFFMINYSAIINFKIEIKRQGIMKREKNKEKILIQWLLDRMSMLEGVSNKTNRQVKELKKMIKENKK